MRERRNVGAGAPRTWNIVLRRTTRNPSSGLRPQYVDFVNYLAWLHEQATETHPRHEQMALLRMEFRDRAKRKKPRSEEGAGGGERLGLTREQRDLFQRVIVPGAPGNPFSSMAERNFALLSLSFNLGMRSGGVARPKVRGLRPQD